MLWHRFAQQLELYDVEKDATQKLNDTPGQFQAPMWSPVDDRLLFGISGKSESLTDLVIADGEKRSTVIADLESPVSFEWSPDATKIASVSAFGNLTVTDVQTGKSLATSPEVGVVAYFWSPQGDRVAYIAIKREPSGSSARPYPSPNGRNGRSPALQGQAPTSLLWNILDVKSGKTTELTKFIPTQTMIYYLNFFDQFARSHRLWSPDGHYLVYGAVDLIGQDMVMLADTTKPGTTIPVSEGAIGVWSWK
jgi:TolB protein